MSRLYKIDEDIEGVGMNTLVISNPNISDIKLDALRAVNGDVIIKIKDEASDAVIMFGDTTLGKEYTLKAGAQNNFVCKNTSTVYLINKQNVSIARFPYLYNVNAEDLNDVAIQTFFIGLNSVAYPEVNVDCSHFPKMNSVTSVQIYNSSTNISFSDLSMLLNVTAITVGTKIEGKIEDLIGCLKLSTLSINKSGNIGDFFKLAKNQFKAGRKNGVITGGYWANGNTVTFNGTSLKFSDSDKIEWDEAGCTLTNGTDIISVSW